MHEKQFILEMFLYEAVSLSHFFITSIYIVNETGSREQVIN